MKSKDTEALAAILAHTVMNTNKNRNNEMNTEIYENISSDM